MQIRKNSRAKGLLISSFPFVKHLYFKNKNKRAGFHITRANFEEELTVRLLQVAQQQIIKTGKNKNLITETVIELLQQMPSGL